MDYTTEQELMPFVDPEMWEELLTRVSVPQPMTTIFPARKVSWAMRVIYLPL